MINWYTGAGGEGGAKRLDFSLNPALNRYHRGEVGWGFAREALGRLIYHTFDTGNTSDRLHAGNIVGALSQKPSCGLLLVAKTS